MIACDARLEVTAVPGIPLIGAGDDVPAIVLRALGAAEMRVADGDVLVVTSKLLSRAEGRFVELPRVEPSPRAVDVGRAIGKDPRVVELILRESTAISRQAPGVLVVRHRLGFVVANAGIDASNAVPPGAAPGSGPWALLLPENPDASAAAIRARVEAAHGAHIGVVITDSFGRPFRLGTVGVAIGASGLPPLWDRRGESDLFGRALEQTITALADQIAAVADLVAGQAAEGRPVSLVRGLRFDPSDAGAASLCRKPEEDLLRMKVVALSGGVGGARLLDGLARALPAGALTAVVNTGDDFVHLGLNVSPDLDTVMYTLSGLAHEERGWGLTDETFAGLSMVKRYGGPDWFALGDRDLATHLLRTEALRAGDSLSAITAHLCGALGIEQSVLPMSDGRVGTLIETDEGTLPFQRWFVGRRAEPRVRAVRFDGEPVAAPGVIEAIEACDVVVVGPSNPYVSVDPILWLRGVRDAIARRPVVALSPIVGGAAVKGPLAAMIPDLAGEAPSAGAVARHYRGLVTAMVVERGDEGTVDAPTQVLGTSTVMRSRADRLTLAQEILAFAERIAR